MARWAKRLAYKRELESSEPLTDPPPPRDRDEKVLGPQWKRRMTEKHGGKSISSLSMGDPEATSPAMNEVLQSVDLLKIILEHGGNAVLLTRSQKVAKWKHERTLAFALVCKTWAEVAKTTASRWCVLRRHYSGGEGMLLLRSSGRVGEVGESNLPDVRHILGAPDQWCSNDTSTLLVASGNGTQLLNVHRQFGSISRLGYWSPTGARKLAFGEPPQDWQEFEIFYPTARYSSSYKHLDGARVLGPRAKYLYVIETGAHCIHTVSVADKQIVSSFGRRGSGEGEFDFDPLSGLTHCPKRNLLIAIDSSNERVVFLNTSNTSPEITWAGSSHGINRHGHQSLKTVGKYGAFRCPTQAAVHGDSLFVLSCHGSRNKSRMGIAVLSLSTDDDSFGRCERWIGGKGSGIKGELTGVAVHDGKLYVTNKNSIHVLSPETGILWQMVLLPHISHLDAGDYRYSIYVDGTQVYVAANNRMLILECCSRLRPRVAARRREHL